MPQRVAERMVRLAAAAYALALRALPAPLVELHGAEMRGAFEARLRAKPRRGIGVFAVLAHGVADILAHGTRARLNRPGARRHGMRRASIADRVTMFMNDLRLAARNLARRPGFTVVATLTLALGIGANVAMFAVVHSVLLQPLPFPDSDRLVWIRHHAPAVNLPELENSTGTLAVYRDQARSFADLASVEQSQRNLSGADAPRRLQVAVVSPTLFDVLQVQPLFGRRLIDADAEPGASPVAVLTHVAWQTEFGGAPDVVGRTVELDGVNTEIVGVMPRSYTYPQATTAALLPRPRDDDPVFGTFGIGGLARLAPGVSLATAQTELSALQARHVEAYSLPSDFLANTGWSVSVRTLHDVTVGDSAAMLWIVLGTVAFLLLVACASVANLFLVRAESRQREFGVRLALGAGRGRVASALLSESLLLGLAGGLWGVLMAWAAVRVLVASGPSQLPRLHEVAVGVPVLLFAALVSVGAGLLFGLLPLPQQLRGIVSTLVRAGRGETGGRDRQRLRRALIVVQIALALVLLTGSGLMLRSFQQLRAIDPGVDPEGTLVVGISGSERADRDRNAARYLEMLDAARGISGVVAAGISNMLPIVPDGVNGGGFHIEGQPRPDGVPAPVTMWAGISDGYFAAAGTPFVAGRDLTSADVAQAHPVVLVNEHLARGFFDGDAVGRRIRFGEDEVWYEIVGVVGDTRTFGLREEIRPMAYLPLTSPQPNLGIQTGHLFLRTHADPMALAAPVRALIRDIDPNAPILSARTLQSVLDESLADLSFTSTVLATASLIALLLGAIGLYGVISYAVAERRAELGVRAALGASPAHVRAMVLKEGAALGCFGIMLGLAGAAALTRVMDSVLFEISSRDPLTFAVVASILIAVTFISIWLPARRAAHVDPLEAIRGTG
jgi:putative ABC transport system permease protein